MGVIYLRHCLNPNIESYKLNPPKMFNILWRDKFSKALIWMNKRDLRAATQILTGNACLNYHLTKLNRSVQPLCPLCEAEYDTVPHLLAQCPMLWQLRVEYFDTHYTTVTVIVDRYNLRRIIGYVNRTSEQTVWSSETLKLCFMTSRAIQKQSFKLLYDLDLSSQYLRFGSFAMRSGPCLDNC